MEVPQELDKLGLEPPAWARDHHEVEWESEQAPRRVWEPAPTLGPPAG